MQWPTNLIALCTPAKSHRQVTRSRQSFLLVTSQRVQTLLTRQTRTDTTMERNLGNRYRVLLSLESWLPQGSSGRVWRFIWNRHLGRSSTPRRFQWKRSMTRSHKKENEWIRTQPSSRSLLTMPAHSSPWTSFSFAKKFISQILSKYNFLISTHQIFQQDTTFSVLWLMLIAQEEPATQFFARWLHPEYLRYQLPNPKSLLPSPNLSTKFLPWHGSTIHRFCGLILIPTITKSSLRLLRRGLTRGSWWWKMWVSRRIQLSRPRLIRWFWQRQRSITLRCMNRSRVTIPPSTENPPLSPSTLPFPSAPKNSAEN